MDTDFLQYLTSKTAGRLSAAISKEEVDASHTVDRPEHTVSVDRVHLVGVGRMQATNLWQFSTVVCLEPRAGWVKT